MISNIDNDSNDNIDDTIYINDFDWLIDWLVDCIITYNMYYLNKQTTIYNNKQETKKMIDISIIKKFCLDHKVG
jgi:hypothetical protein